MIWTGLGFLNALTVFQLCLFASFLLAHGRGKRSSNRLLAAFLLSLALPLLSFILYRSSLSFYLGHPYLFWLGNSAAFLWGPSLYLYARSLIDKRFKLVRSDVLHLAPWLVYGLFKAVRFLVAGRQAQLELLIIGKIYDLDDLLVAGVFLHLVVLAYILATLRLLKRYRAQARNEFSSIDRIKLSWLRGLILGFYAVWALALANSIISYSARSPLLLMCVVNVGYIFIAANVFLVKGLRQSATFDGLEPQSKYMRSTLDPAEADRHLARLRAYMDAERPYLEPSLSLGGLARDLSLPPRHLSQIINERTHGNFMDFVNGYRVREAQRLLRSDAGTTVLDILYESGFNSKASFNAAFKRQTGMTPSRFRKQAGFVSGS